MFLHQVLLSRHSHSLNLINRLDEYDQSIKSGTILYIAKTKDY